MSSGQQSQREFTELWAEAVFIFQERSNIKMQEICRSKIDTVDKLITNLERRTIIFDKANRHGVNLRRILQTTLTPIRLFSEIASAGVSIVFPPARAIFGAVSYLLNTAVNVGKAFDSVPKLLEGMSAFSDRLEKYVGKDGKDTPAILKPILIKFLCAYLEVQAITLKVLRGRFNMFISIGLLNSDKGICAALERLDRLTKLEIAAAVVVLRDEFHEAEKQQTEKLNRIAAHIGLNSLREAERSLFPTRFQPEFASADIRQSVQDTALDNIGTWILKDHKFKSWATLNPQSNRVICLVGDPGTGKSYLCHQIIKHLTASYALGQANQLRRYKGLSVISLAYYFCRSDRPELQLGNTLLKSLAYQVAKTDQYYREYICNVNDLDRISDTTTLWDRLFMEFSPKKYNSWIFLIIYGFDGIQEKARESILSSVSNMNQQLTTESRISVMFITSPRIRHELARHSITMDQQIEILPKMIQDDFSSYIDYHAADLYCFSRSPHLTQLIKSTLKEHAHKSFLWINAMFDELKDQIEENKILELLKHTSEKWKDLFQGNLARLSQRLTQQQIEVLNDILPWVIFIDPPISIEALSRAVNVSNEGNRIIGLQELIEYQYGMILGLQTCSGHRLSLNPGVLGSAQPIDPDMQSFRQDTFHTDYLDDSVYVVLQHPEIKSILPTEGSGVRMDILGASLLVLRTCLQIFCDREIFEKCRDDLAAYAARLDILISNGYNSSLALKDRCLIVRSIFQLFSNPECIARWISVGRDFSERCLVSDNFLVGLCTWIEDEKLEEIFQQEMNLLVWMKKLKDNPIHVFYPVAVECGRRWLEEDIARVDEEVLFIHNYTVKDNPSPTGHFETSLRNLDDKRITDLATWAHYNGQNSDHRCRLAIAHIRAGGLASIRKARQLAKSAMKLDRKNGNAFLCFGKTFLHVSRMEQKAIRHIKKGLHLLSEHEKKIRFDTFETLYRYGGDPLPDIDDMTSASDSIGQGWILEHHMDALLRSYKYEKVTEMLQHIVGADLSYPSTRQWKAFFWELSTHMPHHQRLMMYALATRNRQLVDELYQRGLNVLSLCNVSGVRPVFYYYYAVFNLRLNYGTTHAGDLLTRAADDFHAVDIDTAYSRIRYCASIEAGVRYLTNALRPRPMVNFRVGEQEKQFFSDLEGKLARGECLEFLALPLAVWYREKENDPAKCRRMLSNLISRQISLICTGTDQISAWYILSDALVAAGAESDAITALKFIKQYRLHNERTTRAKRVYSGFFCDSCGRLIMAGAVHQRCSICINLDFCNDCSSMLKNGTNPLALCDKKHRFFDIPGVADKATEGHMTQKRDCSPSLKDLLSWLQQVKDQYEVQVHTMKNGVAV